MRSVLVVVTALAATPASADDQMLVAIDSAGLIVYKLKPTGIDKVLVDTSGKASGAGWTDARTLWVLNTDASNQVWVTKVIDGKVADKLVIPADSWKLEGDATLSPKLKITSNNEIWVEHCLKARGDTGKASLTCVKGIWIRVDGKTQKVQTTQPNAIDHYRASGSYLGDPPPFPKVKPPKGYAVTLQQVVADGVGETQKKRKVKGGICKGPSATKTWPDDTVDIDFAMKPNRVTWLREASPVVVMIDGNATNPIGDIEHHEAVFIDCKELVDQASWFGAGFWGIRRGDVWTIYSDDKALGSLSGQDLRAAPLAKK
jgi:hypothetical protein